VAISNLTTGLRSGVCTSTTRPTAPYEELKTCSRCKQEKLIAEFSKDSTQPTGLNYQCKSCRKEINKKSYNKTKTTTDTHQICTKCLDTKTIEDFYKDPRSRNGYMRKCKNCHNKICSANNKKRPEATKAAAAKWRKNNPDKIKILNSATKSRRRKSERKLFSRKDWLYILRQYRSCCAYCGGAGDLTMDHVVPLIRGGRHSVGNIVPACRSCNSSKNRKFIVEWRKSKWL
jgi:hypothetical protein